MKGQLLEKDVLVPDVGDASRLMNKGQYGRSQSGGGLRLDLVEATYLVEVGRLDVSLDGTRLDATHMAIQASLRRPGFEVPYLVYRDFRERGYLVRPPPPEERKGGADFLHWGRGSSRDAHPTAWVHAVNEREPCEFSRLHAFATRAAEAKCLAHLAIVDEESDLTHYELTTQAPAGPTRTTTRGPPAAALLMEDRVVVPDPRFAVALHGAEFYGKPVAQSLHLSLLEAAFLAQRGDVQVREALTGRPVALAALRRRGRELESTFLERSRVYADLRGRGLIVKTGYKFGTHFRAYEESPDEAHAPFLLQAVPAGFTSPWEPVARAVRLSHSVRKRFYLASAGVREVEYLGFGRFRP